MGKAALINHYLDTMGGGERYFLAVAQVLDELGYEVFIEWKDPSIKNKLENRFGINLRNINFLEDVKKGDGYDLCFWVSDGSIPLLRARKNILHFQFPFTNVDGKSLLNRMKMFRINKIVCNSNFTKDFIDNEFGVNSLVIYPPIDVVSIKSKRKENIILFVGRFSKLTQNKGQDILIEVFNKMKLIDWKLVLAGGIEIGLDSDMQNLIKNTSQNIEIFKSPDYKTLKDLYGKAKMFWSASGYGIDQNKNPEKLEHFGMTVVEAMASGAVPLIYDAGGHKEIVTDEVDGYLWNSEDELIERTNSLINNKIIWKNLSVNAKQTSKKFSYAKFRENITEIL